MRSIGIKQLKARLSEYVRLARGGETILVTDRDEVVAELGPVRRQVADADSLEATLERLADQGVITRAGQAKKGWAWEPTNLGLPEGTARSILDEIRGDR